MVYGRVRLESRSTMELDNGTEQKMFTRSDRRKLDEEEFKGFTTEGENIREELGDETAGNLMMQKLLAIVEKQDEKLQKVDEEIRKLMNIIKVHYTTNM